MRLWQRRVLGTLTLGGSFLGFSLGFERLVTPNYAFNRLLLMPFIGLYIWGLWCGIALFEGAAGALRSSRCFWAFQIPVLYSPIVSYMFTSGCLLAISFRPAEVTFNFDVRLGSQFGYSLMQPAQPWIFGFNVVAAGICIFLTWCIRRQAPILHLGANPVLGPAPSVDSPQISATSN